MHPLGYVIVTATVVGSGFLIYGWLRRSLQASESAFRQGIVDDAAGWLAGHLHVPAPDVARDLRQLIDQRTPSRALDRLLRIDVEVSRTKPDACELTVVVALRGPEQNVLVGKIAREVGWENLPGDVRREFIHSGKAVQCFILVQKAA